jgi:hypothetical protein
MRPVTLSAALLLSTGATSQAAELIRYRHCEGLADGGSTRISIAYHPVNNVPWSIAVARNGVLLDEVAIHQVYTARRNAAGELTRVTGFVAGDDADGRRFEMLQDPDGPHDVFLLRASGPGYALGGEMRCAFERIVFEPCIPQLGCD